MGDGIKMSVVVLTYNPDWTKFRNTLKSILLQKGVGFEIVIADDGSKYDCFDKAERFFIENNFSNYKLVRNPVNKGTVKNFLSALSVAECKYVKPISPGDFFYDDNTLQKMFEFTEKHPAAFYFCNRIAYSLGKDNAVTLYDSNKEPKNLIPWLRGDIRKIRWDYLVYQDYLCGAACFYNTKSIERYLTQISPFVKFADDFSVVYMLANNEVGYFVADCGGVWYECDTGISNQKDDYWWRVFDKENERLFFHLMEKKIIPEWIYKIHYTKNKFEGRFLRLIHCPQLLLRRFLPKNVIKGYKNLKYDVCELKRILDDGKRAKNDLLISVAMVTYNGERYLREQIDSILNQTINCPLEIVVCDDGSVDGTRKILEEYAASDSRFKLFFNETNLGVGRNFEKAISLCNGEYIALSDQDDVWEKDKLEKLYEKIGDKDFIFSDALLVDADNNPIGVTMKNACNYKYVPESKMMLFKRLVHQNFVQGAAMLARSNFLKKLPPIPSSVDGHDYWFALNACVHKGFSYLDECTVRYRRHKHTASSVNKRMPFINELRHFSFTMEDYKERVVFAQKKVSMCETLLSSSMKFSESQKKYLEKTLAYYKRANDRSFSSFVYFLMNCWSIYLDRNIFVNSFRVLKNFFGVLIWKIYLRRKFLA